MFDQHPAWLRSSFRGRLKIAPTRNILIGCLVAGLCIVGLLVFVMRTAEGHPYTPASSRQAVVQPTLQVDIGFQGSYRNGFWTPIIATLENKGPDFKGKLSARIYTRPPRTGTISQISTWSFEQAVTLPKNAHKQVTLYAPFSLGNFVPNGALATLSNENGTVVTTATSPSLGAYEVQPGNLFFGLLAPTQAKFGALSNVNLPNQTSSLTWSFLDASTMPTVEVPLENFDVIVLDNFPTNTLNSAQILALRTWVNRGGILLEVGGQNWHSTLGSLPADMLPVKIHGTTTLPAGTVLIPSNGSTPPHSSDQSLPVSLSQPLPVSFAVLNPQDSFSQSQTLLTSGSNPLMVQAHQGEGIICYLAFDPTNASLINWPGISAFWQTLLLHTLGDRVLLSTTTNGTATGPGQILMRGGIISMIEPAPLPGPWIIGVLFIGYLLVLGPVRLLLIRRFRLASWWRWRIFLASVVTFSLLAYGLAALQRGASLTNNSISIIQINQTSSSAHITTYMDLYTNDQGDFRLHIPGDSLTQPVTPFFLRNNLAASLPTSQNDLPITSVSDERQTDLTMHNLGLWTANPVVVEQDRALQGTITSHLSLRYNRLVGTITNTLATPLSDVYVLLPHSFIAIGHISSGETQQVNLPLFSTPPDSGKTLSDQIANHSGLPASYFPYTNKQLPQTDVQNHASLLSALNGAGYTYIPCYGSCYQHGIANRGFLYITGGQIPNPSLRNSFDPLLSGTPATLIGWADQPVDNINGVSINGQVPGGHHENFIQMPLNIELSSSLSVPPDFITAQMVDIQSSDAQMVLPGMYSMSIGNVTFELMLPTTQRNQISSMTIVVPDLIASPSGPNSGPSLHASTLQARLYNWHTHTWESIKLNQDIFTTTNIPAYVGPDGRILVRIANLDTPNAPQQFFFGKPSLQLEGTTSS